MFWETGQAQLADLNLDLIILTVKAVKTEMSVDDNIMLRHLLCTAQIHDNNDNDMDMAMRRINEKKTSSKKLWKWEENLVI